jgi:glycosyltransferase involved in cell wall biosynthesis
MPGDTPCIQDELTYLQKHGVVVDLLVIDRTNKLNYLKAALKLFLLSFQPKRYDLIHAYYGHCGLLARLQLRSPVIVTFRGADLVVRLGHRFERDAALGKIVARLVDDVIVMSDEMKAASGRPDAYVIPFGVNPNIFKRGSMEEARRKLALPLGKKLILFPWNPVRPQKRFDLVEQAVALLKPRHIDVQLVAVYDKPHEVLAQYMNACDVLILASDREGSPVAVREAVVCGLPIVAVDIADVRQMLEGREDCYLSKMEAGALAENLSLALQRGRTASETASIERFVVDYSARQVLGVYEHVLGKTGITGVAHA